MSNYCSQKFWWLSVEPERRQVQSCCAAYPHKIDINWLKKNPGRLFNIPVLQQERQAMLDNHQVPSCEASCWAPERDGKISRRTRMGSTKQTHTNINSTPETIHINVGSDCNLTCVYCTRQYSTAWLRDIVENGPYLDDPRYKINSNDKILLNLGQKKINETETYNLILEEIAKYKDCETVYISGGEPFLNNNLVALLKQFNQKIKLYTGLGISTDRLERVLADMPDNVEFGVSAENINEHYEFIRYNNTFEKFERNLNLLKKNRKVSFSCTITNLTIFNFKQFEEYADGIPIEIGFCNEPDYLSANVLDDHSKNSLLLTNFANNDQDIKDTLKQSYSEEKKHNLKKFLTEYTRRRNLDISIFPKHFVNWLNTPQ